MKKYEQTALHTVTTEIRGAKLADLCFLLQQHQNAATETGDHEKQKIESEIVRNLEQLIAHRAMNRYGYRQVAVSQSHILWERDNDSGNTGTLTDSLT